MGEQSPQVPAQGGKPAGNTLDTTGAPAAPVSVPERQGAASEQSVSSTAGRGKLPSHSGGLASSAEPNPPSQSSTPRSGPYNMIPMANALPHDPYRTAGSHFPSGGQQHHYTPSPPATVMRNAPQVPPYGAAPPMPMMNHGYYAQNPPPPPPMGQYYGAGHMSPAQSPASIPPRQNVPYYPNQMVMGHVPQAYYYPQATPYNPGIHGMTPMVNPPMYMGGGGSTMGASARPPAQATATQVQLDRHKQSSDASDKKQNAVRGPPRKPRQSGHAIWIGNLPPQTELMSLVQHVCKEAPGLESLFLISKSNCAFANYKDEAACVEAQQKLHDSKFYTVRLVSRLRKSTVEGAGGATAPTGPAASSSASATTTSTAATTPAEELSTMSPKPTSVPGSPVGTLEQPAQMQGSKPADAALKDRFFILKSLTVEDLELSVGTGIWATQSHNEQALNSAFKAADNVYLIFSANKSGEYFGYARMVSEINEDPAAAIEFAPTSQAMTDVELPKAIPTEASEHVPKGRIIDDSARGTIFWELEREDDTSGDTASVSEDDTATASARDPAAEDEEDRPQTWGKPLKLEWLSTNRLPFYRTRGLRNPWNSNREVKVARDGTELETSVGRKLIGLFNRVQMTPQGQPVAQGPPQPQQPAPFVQPVMRGPPPMGGPPVYPRTRPFGP